MPSRTPTRFPAGTTNVDKFKQFGSIQMPDPQRFHLFVEDWDRYVATDYTLTETQAGATQALANGDGGLMLFTNSAANADVCSLQKVGESFIFEDKMAIFGKVRFQVSDATLSDALCGLAVTDTSPIASAPSDGIYFLKSTAQTGVVFRVGKASSYTVSASILTMANATNYTLGFACNGVQYSVNGVLSYVFNLFAGTDHNPPFITKLYVPVTNTPTAQTMTPTLSLQNGAAAAKTLTSDYMVFGKSRF